MDHDCDDDTNNDEDDDDFVKFVGSVWLGLAWLHFWLSKTLELSLPVLGVGSNCT